MPRKTLRCTMRSFVTRYQRHATNNAPLLLRSLHQTHPTAERRPPPLRFEIQRLLLLLLLLLLLQSLLLLKQTTPAHPIEITYSPSPLPEHETHPPQTPDSTHIQPSTRPRDWHTAAGHPKRASPPEPLPRALIPEYICLAHSSLCEFNALRVRSQIQPTSRREKNPGL